MQYYHCGVIGGLWCICHDGEREELSSGEDQPCGGGDPAAGVGTDDRVCAVKMTGRNREQRSGAHLFQVRKMNVKWRHDTWNKI